jgi:hypothetical protein
VLPLGENAKQMRNSFDFAARTLSRGVSYQRGFRRAGIGLDGRFLRAVLVVDIEHFADRTWSRPAFRRAGDRDALVEDRGWATIPTHLEPCCPVRVGLGGRQPFTPVTSPYLPRVPTLDVLLAYVLRLFRLSLRAVPGIVLALLIRAGRAWIDFRPARSPGRIVRCGGQVTRGPDISRMTQFPVIRGVPLVCV